MSNHWDCDWDCGGTGCDAPQYASTAEVLPKCKHSNGWHDEMRVILGFKIKVFICTDCMEIINKKDLK